MKIGEKNLEVRGVRSMINSNLKEQPAVWKLERHWLLDGDEEHAPGRPPVEELLKDPAYLSRVKEQALRRQVYMLYDWAYEGIHFGLMPVLEDEAGIYGMTSENRHMVDSFRQGRQPAETFEDGVAVMEVLMALYRSAEIGQVVKLPAPELETYVPPVARGGG